MKKFLKTAFFVCVSVCIVVALTVSVGAINEASDGSRAGELSIVQNRVVATGETLQMQATGANSSIVWSSNNSNVISCTSNGKITGISKGYATISAICGSSSASLVVYCVERVKSEQITSINQPIAFTSTVPGYFPIQTILFNFSPVFKHQIRKIKGVYGSYLYIEYNAWGENYKGFIHKNRVSDGTNSSDIFSSLSSTNLNIFVGHSKSLTANYSGSVFWSVSNSDIISYDSSTGTVTAKAPGIATVSAKANGKTLTCTVHSIYEWPREWTGKAKTATYVYRADGKDYVKSTTAISSGGRFTVKGDLGNSDGYAYGVTSDDVWGYVPIKDISTKNTISFYNNLNWRYPLQNTSYNYISSPYAPRSDSTSTSIHHRGMDITTGTPGEIKGAYVVAAASGVVKRIRNNTDNCGYCISIQTDDTDPVTGKNICMIYMHLLDIPKYQDNSAIQNGDHITVGTVIGKVGNSDGNPTSQIGYHLHFEANNLNAAVGDAGRSDFTNTLNPIYFYADKTFRFSQTTSYNTYGGYWYNY